MKKGEELSEFNRNLLKTIKMSDSKKSQPKISLNKLGEYMTADPLRRRQIVKDAKSPVTFKTGRYSEATEFIKDYIKSGCDVSIIANGISVIKEKEKNSSWQKDDGGNSMTLLKHVLILEFPDLSDYEILNFNEENVRIDLAGVSVSVRPDLILKHRITGKTGAIKLHLPKTYPLNQESLEYVATMVKYYFINLGYKESEISDQACIAIDIPTQLLIHAPKAYSRSVNRIKASCEEIALRWDSL